MSSIQAGYLRERTPEPREEEAEFPKFIERVRLETARLAKRQAEAFWLCCVEQISYEEAATQMDTDANSIGILIHHTRLRLPIKAKEGANRRRREECRSSRPVKNGADEIELTVLLRKRQQLQHRQQPTFDELGWVLSLLGR